MHVIQHSNINPPPVSFGIKQILLVSALFCFTLSLFQVSLFTSGDEIRGFWALIMGWFGLVIFQFAWFANPVNLLALLIMTQKPRVSLFLSVLAFILASQTFIFSEIPVGLDGSKIYIKELGLGFYLWYLAQGLFLITALIEAFNRDTLRKKL